MDEIESQLRRKVNKLMVQKYRSIPTQKSVVGNSEGVEVSFKAKTYKNMNLEVSIGLQGF